MYNPVYPGDDRFLRSSEVAKRVRAEQQAAEQQAKKLQLERDLKVKHIVASIRLRVEYDQPIWSQYLALARLVFDDAPKGISSRINQDQYLLKFDVKPHEHRQWAALSSQDQEDRNL